MSSSMRPGVDLLQQRQETLERFKQTLETNTTAHKPQEAKEPKIQNWGEYEKAIAQAEKQYTTTPSAENLKHWEDAVTQADAYNHKKLIGNNYKAKNVLRINQIKDQLTKINTHKNPPPISATPVTLPQQPTTKLSHQNVTATPDQKAAELEMEQQLATLNKAEKQGNKKLLADVVIEQAFVTDEPLIDLITDLSNQAAHPRKAPSKPDNSKIVQIQQKADEVAQTFQTKLADAVGTAPDITTLEKQAEELKQQGAIFTPKKHLKAPGTGQTSNTSKSESQKSEKNSCNDCCNTLLSSIRRFWQKDPIPPKPAVTVKPPQKKVENHSSREPGKGITIEFH